MNIEELRETSTWTLYQKHLNFMNLKKIFSDTDKNYRFYNGDQWEGLKLKETEKIQNNFIKQIVKQKVSNITSNLYAVNYSPENIENPEFFELAQKTCDLLNKRASKVWDKDFMDKKVKKWAKQSAINDEAINYVTYDFENDNPINEIISKNDIMYGNENEEEIQLQPYILIRQRKTIIELEEMARNEQIPEEIIKNAITDSDTSTASGDSAKDEVEDKVWLITKFYKRNGKVYFNQATQYCDIKEEKDTGLTLYPIAHFNWEDQEGNARGIGEVRQLIPNQIEANKIAMRRAIVSKRISYPQVVVNEDAIQNINDIGKIGSTIRMKDMGGARVSDFYTITQPGQMGTDGEKLQNELITLSKDLNNASDATTGNVNPESASGRAILAVQNAQNQPLNDQMIGLKSFLEDTARIWFEMWKTYAQDGLIIEIENVDPITGNKSAELTQVPNYILEALNTNVKIDMTPKGALDKYAQELSLENLFTSGKISFDEYVDSLDTDSVMPKVKLENIVKKRHENDQRIASMEQEAIQLKNQMQFQMANDRDIDSIAQQGNQLAMQNQIS